MQVPGKEIQANCKRDEESIKSKPSTIYKHKKFLRSRFEKAMSLEENSSSSNVSSLGPNKQEKVTTAAAQPPLPPNPPPPDNPPMIDILKREIVDDENKCGSTGTLTEFNQPKDLTAAAPVATTAQSEGQPTVPMCRDFARGTCKKGAACIFAHQIILSQLPGVYIFCKDFQNAACSLPKCKFVHATVYQQEHYLSTGYLPPYTLAHLEEFSVLHPPPPPPTPQSEEALAMQPTVYCNVPPPPPPISCTPAVGYNVEGARERSKRDIFRAQPGTSTASQNPEQREIDTGMYFNTKLFSTTEAKSIDENSSSLNVSSLRQNIQRKVTTAAALPPLPPSPPPPMIDILKQDIEDDEFKCGSTESLTELNQQGELTAAAPITTTAQSEKLSSVTMCRNYIRGLCRLGAACKFEHEVILSQLPGVYVFCNNFQNARCTFPKCKLVHATVFEQQHFYRTGYLPPYTLAHLKESSVVAPPPPPPQSEERVYCNVLLPPPSISCTSAIAVGYNAEAARERSKLDTFRAQPGTSTSSQNPERSEINEGIYFNTKLFSATEAMSIEENSSSSNVSSLRQNKQRKVTTAAVLPPLPPSPPPPMIDILKQDIEDVENKCGSTESLTEFKQQEELSKPVTITAESERQPTLTMCRNFVRGICRLGERCIFEHEIILSQLPGVYTFCRHFQNSVCPFLKCKFVHASVFEQEHFFRTGYLPLHTRAHLKEFSLLQPPPPPPQSEEVSAVQPTVYCNVPPPPPPLSCTPTVAEKYTADIFRAQPGTSTSSQSPERSEIDKEMYFNTKLFSASEAMSIEENSSSSNVSSLGQNLLKTDANTPALAALLLPNPPPKNEKKSGSTQSFTEFNQQEELTTAAPVATTSQFEEKPSVTMCRDFVRGTCKKGMACIFAHQIILSQLPWVYTFCRNFQNSICSTPCKFVHATVFEKEHFYRTGYLPPHTLAHLKESNGLTPPPPPQSEEASEDLKVYCNVPPPPLSISCTPAVGYNVEAARERSKRDTFRAQPVTSTSSQNPERSEIGTGMYFKTKMSIEEYSSSSNVSSLGHNIKKITTAVAQPPLPPNPPPRNENKRGSTESLTEFNQQEATTAQSEEKPRVTMCRNFARGNCKKGVACLFKHEIILSQLPGVYTFCRNFQNAECSLSKCKFVHATVFEKEHFYRTGYLPPHTLAHLKESNGLTPPPPPPQSEEALAVQPTVYCNVPPPPPPISWTPPVAVGYNAVAVRKRSELDTFRPQPGTSTSSQNPEWRGIDEASSSTCDDSAKRCNKCPSREQSERKMDAKIADARRRLDKKRKQMAKIDMECEIMDAIISMYNNHLDDRFSGLGVKRTRKIKLQNLQVAAGPDINICYPTTSRVMLAKVLENMESGLSPDAS